MARLSKRQLKEIQNKVDITPSEKVRIKSYNYAWDYKNLNDIINKIRGHYIKEQDGLCAFCKLPFRDEIHVEHLIPKGGKQNPRIDFSYEPENLSVCCGFCNTKKSTHNDSICPPNSSYPKSPIYFKIIHPHFDTYFKHIRIVDKSRYTALTTKGYNTIERCKLYEATITDLLVRYMRYEDDPIVDLWIKIKDMRGNFTATIDRLINKAFK